MLLMLLVMEMKTDPHCSFYQFCYSTFLHVANASVWKTADNLGVLRYVFSHSLDRWVHVLPCIVVPNVHNMREHMSLNTSSVLCRFHSLHSRFHQQLITFRIIYAHILVLLKMCMNRSGLTVQQTTHTPVVNIWNRLPRTVVSARISWMTVQSGAYKISAYQARHHEV